jgi:hypothetical protein
MSRDSLAPSVERSERARSTLGLAFGPARARVARILRDDGATRLRFLKGAVYLPGLTGAPRLLASSFTELDDDPPSAVERPSPLRLAALRARADGSSAPFVLPVDGGADGPPGELLVLPLVGEPGLAVWLGSLVLYRDVPWSSEEQSQALALARSVGRALMSLPHSPGP